MKVIKWGIVGAGDIVKKRVAPAINELPESELIAIVRGRAELAETSATDLGARRWYADWREMMADSEIDAVTSQRPFICIQSRPLPRPKQGSTCFAKNRWR